MMKQPVPHSPEWFAALQRQNPTQVAQTRVVISVAGHDGVCSVCGDEPVQDWQVNPEDVPSGMVGSVRLCDDCFEIRSTAGERLIPLYG